MGRGNAEQAVVAWKEVREHAIGLLDGGGAGAAHLGAQAVLEGVRHPFHAALCLGRMGHDEFDAQLLEGASELGGLPRALELYGKALGGTRKMP